jgi:hypothetical protein
MDRLVTGRLGTAENPSMDPVVSDQLALVTIVADVKLRTKSARVESCIVFLASLSPPLSADAFAEAWNPVGVRGADFSNGYKGDQRHVSQGSESPDAPPAGIVNAASGRPHSLGASAQLNP